MSRAQHGGRRLSLWRHSKPNCRSCHSGWRQRCRHCAGSHDDKAVAELFERVKAEHGRLDILVNNAAKLVAAPTPGGFWEKPLGSSVDLISVGLRSHFVAAYYAVPLLIANGRGLIVNTGHYGSVCYHYGPAYGAQKAGADKMAADMAKELRPHKHRGGFDLDGSARTERAVRTLLAFRKIRSRSSNGITAIHR